MENFIQSQIDSFNGKKYTIKTIIQRINKYVESNKYAKSHKYKNILNGWAVIAEIKNNQIINLPPHIDLETREGLVYLTLIELLKCRKIKDTVLIIELKDGYNWELDLPIFNFAIPGGKRGLIFTPIELNYFYHLKTDFDGIKKLFINYNPKKIINDIYFKGGRVSERKSHVRETLEKSKHPINVDLSKGKTNMYYFKDHKYVLDLPGVKPWSERFKYLCFSKRLIIRVSLYNSKYKESGSCIQYLDYLYNTDDYVELLYDCDYDKKLSSNTLKQIEHDILKVYAYYEKHPKEYKKKVDSMTKKSKQVCLKTAYDYLEKLINAYTDDILSL